MNKLKKFWNEHVQRPSESLICPLESICLSGGTVSEFPSLEMSALGFLCLWFSLGYDAYTYFYVEKHSSVHSMTIC